MPHRLRPDHFKAPAVPSKEAAPISCAHIAYDYADTERALLAIRGVHDIAVRTRAEGAPNAFVCLEARRS